jgi:hypothetical protein
VRVLEELARVRTFLVAFVAAIVVASYAEQSGETRLAGLLFLLGPLVVLMWMLAGGLYRRGLAGRFAALERRIACDQRPMPDRFSVVRGELLSLGFGPATVIESRYPWQRWRTVWASLDRDATTTAYVNGTSGVTLATYWRDGSSITTTNKRPARRVDLPGVRQLSMRGQAADAYHTHRDACATFVESHGAPIEINSNADLLAAENLVRPGLQEAYRHWSTRRRAVLTELLVGVFAAMLILLGLIQLAAGSG